MGKCLFLSQMSVGVLLNARRLQLWGETPLVRFLPLLDLPLNRHITSLEYAIIIKTSTSIYFWAWLFHIIRLNPNPIKLRAPTGNSFPTFAVRAAVSRASSGRHVVTLVPRIKRAQTLNIYGNAEIWCHFYNLNWALIQTQWKSTRT